MDPETLALVKRFEGFSARPYLCPADVWTIGWGTTRGADGRAVTGQTPPVTEAEAQALLARDLAQALAAVQRLVTLPLTPGQAGALASFVYNLGASRLKASTLLRRLNAGDAEGAAAEFGKWVMAGGRVLPGLKARRAAERALFLKAAPQALAETPPAEASPPGRLGRFLAAFRQAAA